MNYLNLTKNVNTEAAALLRSEAFPENSKVFQENISGGGIINLSF